MKPPQFYLNFIANLTTSLQVLALAFFRPPIPKLVCCTETMNALKILALWYYLTSSESILLSDLLIYCIFQCL